MQHKQKHGKQCVLKQLTLCEEVHVCHRTADNMMLLQLALLAAPLTIVTIALCEGGCIETCEAFIFDSYTYMQVPSQT